MKKNKIVETTEEVVSEENEIVETTEENDLQDNFNSEEFDLMNEDIEILEVI